MNIKASSCCRELGRHADMCLFFQLKLVCSFGVRSDRYCITFVARGGRAARAGRRAVPPPLRTLRTALRLGDTPRPAR
eukprot:scaffold4962_cov33-Tisochrysis_lutea.AAC.1